MVVSYRRLQALLLADARPGNSLARLETSWDVRLSLARLRAHRWTRGDMQYVFMVPILLFCLFVAKEPPFIFRLGLGLLLATLIAVPITSQFWLPFMPIGTWLFLFYTNQFIGEAWRPSISVRILPALETILYGGNLSEVLAKSTNSLLDVLAWIPYGLVHFGAPFVVSILMFVFGPPGMLPNFAFAFGWMNFIGVSIQILCPCAPPWYQLLYGLDPANYSIKGSAGGLSRVDKLLGFNLYSGTFSTSPVVFGAFPSLHSGCATMEVLFMCHLFPRYAPLFIGYEMWIWWSTMYLTHHYFIDLIGGACLSFTVFYACKLRCLPRMQHDKIARWSYDYVETGIASLPVKLRKSIDDGEFIELPPLETIAVTDYSLPLSAPVPYNPLDRHKTSSYHLYDGDLRATSASSPVYDTTAVNSSVPSSASVSSSSTVVHNHRSNTPSPRGDEPKFALFARSSSPSHQD